MNYFMKLLKIKMYSLKIISKFEKTYPNRLSIGKNVIDIEYTAKVSWFLRENCEPSAIFRLNISQWTLLIFPVFFKNKHFQYSKIAMYKNKIKKEYFGDFCCNRISYRSFVRGLIDKYQCLTRKQYYNKNCFIFQHSLLLGLHTY